MNNVQEEKLITPAVQKRSGNWHGSYHRDRTYAVTRSRPRLNTRRQKRGFDEQLIPFLDALAEVLAADYENRITTTAN